MRSWLLAVVVAGGAVTGVGISAATGGDEVVTAAVSVPTYRCPGEGRDGVLQRGDRVLAIARDSGGDWLQVRAPHDQQARVWVEARFVLADGDTSGLDVASCEDSSNLTFVPATPDTTAPATADEPTSGGGGSGPSGPTDTAGPTITGVSANPTSIYEQDTPPVAGETCANIFGSKVTSVITAQVSDPSGIASVTMSWSVGTTTGSKPMTGGATRSATLGPFPATTIDPGTTPIAVTITARDNAGNTRTASTTVQLLDCEPFA